MLLELFIADFAIIDQVRLHFTPAFNVLTGETGAGKSIMIDALGMLRGERSDPSFVRAGSNQARVEGIFTLADRPDILPILAEYGLDGADDDQIILTREIHGASGRSVARINGRAVSSAVLRDIGGRLVDIHGQNDSQTLFNVRTHAEMLDRYAGVVADREQLSQQVIAIEAVRSQISTLRNAEARRLERIEELTFLVEELTNAKLIAGEEATLTNERGLLQNSAKITGTVDTMYRLLRTGTPASERRSATRSIVDSLDDVANLLSELLRLDPSLAGLNEQTLEVRYRLDDVIEGVRVYRDRLEFEPGRLEVIEDRLAELRDLAKKYRAADAAELLERLTSASDELETLHYSAEHIAELVQQEQQLLANIGIAAAELSRRRRQAGDELAGRIAAAMSDLAMPHVKFHVQLSQRSDPQGVLIDDQYLAFDRTGVDQIEFLLSPNPGEPLKPLAKIASGGESARLLLAMKSILSAVDSVPTLVFDEVDVGVGGRAGHVVGEKLWGISDAHQVLCITHLPQVAAFGDCHFAIAKQVINQRTQTFVQPLSEQERIEELAAMLDGTPVSEASRRSASAMLERAANYKLATSNP
ncbi:MAG: DNA repair protein RecN [Chloroflexi bacterium]|nr:DNA repair protein RecN [Chloroflexota bacterium]